MTQPGPCPCTSTPSTRVCQELHISLLHQQDQIPFNVCTYFLLFREAHSRSRTGFRKIIQPFSTSGQCEHHLPCLLILNAADSESAALAGLALAESAECFEWIGCIIWIRWMSSAKFSRIAVSKEWAESAGVAGLCGFDKSADFAGLNGLAE